MSLFILGAVVLGIVWGFRARPLPPWPRRGVPAAAVIFGIVGLRVSVNNIGVERIQAGALDIYGLMGISLMIFGLFALFFLVIGHIMTELKVSAKLSGRK